jgi:hypothetical protein
MVTIDGLKNMDHMMQEKAASFEQTINQTVNDIIQDVYIAADAAHNAMNSHSTDILKNIDQHIVRCTSIMDAINAFTLHIPAMNRLLQTLSADQTPPQPTISRRWQNITLDPTFRHSPNPYDQPNLRKSNTLDNGPQSTTFC